MPAKGTLFVVATPIGNLQDFSDRARSVLKGVDLIVCESAQRTRTLLGKLEDKSEIPPLARLHVGNEEKQSEELQSRLLDGLSLALVSDAGTPLVSDPGFSLIRLAFESGCKVVPIPGPSALTSALSVCPIPINEFSFVGFLARKRQEREEQLCQLARKSFVIVFFESPRRILETLFLLSKNGFGHRKIFVAREVTKLHEELIFDSVDQVLLQLKKRDRVVGEFVIVLDCDKASQFYELDELVPIFKSERIAPSSGARLLSKICGVPRGEAYKRLIENPEVDD